MASSSSPSPIYEPASRYDLTGAKTTAKAAGEGWVLDGEKSVVIGAPSADKLIVSARTAGKAGDATGLSLFVVDAKAAGVSQSASRTVDGQRAADLRFTGVKLGADALLGPKDGSAAADRRGDRLRHRAALRGRDRLR
jgi:alkylation response protein AidB-like acyl-CoA dehydrogenase